jgi:hypothetical protein
VRGKEEETGEGFSVCLSRLLVEDEIGKGEEHKYRLGRSMLGTARAICEGISFYYTCANPRRVVNAECTFPLKNILAHVMDICCEWGCSR